MKTKCTKILTMAVWLTALISHPVHARLGETLEQCIARYGEPMKKTSENQLTFMKSGFGILVSLHNGKADHILYKKIPENAGGESDKITGNEIEILLKSNAGDSSWEKIESNSIGENWWSTKDGKRFASYATLQRALVVTTAKWMLRNRAEKKEAEEKNLEGF